MFPVFLTIGVFHFYSLSIFLVLAWLTFSFLYWRSLRNSGVAEERIFDLTFYSSLSAFVAARAGYVVTNLDLFQTNMLRAAAIWIAPGLSLYGAILGGLVVLVYLSRQYKVRLGLVLDAFGSAFGWAYVVGLIGAFFDGSYVGTPVAIPWAVRYVGHAAARHPVQIYELISMLIVLFIMAFLTRAAVIKKWSYGLLGLWFIALFAASEFILEFFKDTRVYWGILRANQWVLVALFAETMGAFYVRGGGREKLRPWVNRIGGIYGKFSKRHT